MVGVQKYYLNILAAEWFSLEMLLVDGLSGGWLSGNNRTALVTIRQLSNAACLAQKLGAI